MRCLVCLVLSAHALSAAEPGGLTVRNGQLLRAGRPFAAYGLNVRDLADEILDKGEAATDCFAALRVIGEHKVPFIRFWASYFDNRRKFLADPERYWRHMDLLVAAAERAGVGLAPTLFWDSWKVPWTFDEFCLDWGDQASKTRAFAQRYTRDFLTRYRGRPVFWFWEFSNENNLMWDLPNGLEFLPKDRKVARNLATREVGEASIRLFGETVRELDATRPISSGCSSPRACQWHLARDQANPWANDSAEQSAEAAGWTAPAPVDLLSIHYYARHARYDAELVRAELARYQQIATRMNRPLYVGEFGVLDGHGQTGTDFDEAAYQRHARDLFQAVHEAKVPLSAWWVYSAKGYGRGMGALSATDRRWDFVFDLLAEYNRKLAAG